MSQLEKTIETEKIWDKLKRPLNEGAYNTARFAVKTVKNAGNGLASTMAGGMIGGLIGLVSYFTPALIATEVFGCDINQIPYDHAYAIAAKAIGFTTGLFTAFELYHETKSNQEDKAAYGLSWPLRQKLGLRGYFIERSLNKKKGSNRRHRWLTHGGHFVLTKHGAAYVNKSNTIKAYQKMNLPDDYRNCCPIYSEKFLDEVVMLYGHKWGRSALVFDVRKNIIKSVVDRKSHFYVNAAFERKEKIDKKYESEERKNEI